MQSARIVGGNEATDSQWPSVTLLYNKMYNVQCTATVLSPIWVLASYSCMHPYENETNSWQLLAGSTTFNNDSNNKIKQERNISRIIEHPQVLITKLKIKQL